MAEKALPSAGFKKFTGDGSFSTTNDSLTMVGHIYMFGYDTLGSNFIPISPSGKTYYYDIIYSNTDTNRLYVGLEKFDANKQTVSNNGCVYILSTTAATDHNRVFGTVDLSNVGNGNPTAYTRIRVLNDWDSVSSANTATIHFLSLREVTTLGKTSVYKNGQLTADSFRNTTDGAHIYKNGFVGGTYFYEI